VLAGFATLLILVLIAAFAVPVLVDWTQYRGTVEKAASAVLGRDVKTTGPISVVILPEPRVTVGGVSVGASGQMRSASAEAADIALSLPSLLGGVIEAEQIDLKRPVVEIDLTPSWTANQAATDPLAIKTAIRAVNVQDGQLIVTYLRGRQRERVTMDGVQGSVSGQAGSAYRLAARTIVQGRPLDIKSVVTPTVTRTRVSATVVDLVSKTSFQADGTTFAAPQPVFEGSVSATGAAFVTSDAPLPVQARAGVRADLDGLTLAGLTITIDPDQRAQILVGDAQADFADRTASLSLEAKSLDVDGLLASAATNASAVSGVLGGAMDAMPGYRLSAQLKSGQTQYRGELLSALSLDLSRDQGRWTVQKATATLPGDAILSLSGTASRRERGYALSGVFALKGIALSRFARWAAPPVGSARAIPAKPFEAKGAVSLSADAIAFESITATIGGTPFSGSFRVDNGPPVRVTASVEGDRFDFGDVELPSLTDRLVSLNGRALLDQTGLSALFGRTFGTETVETDVSVKAQAIRTDDFAAKNVSGRVKLSNTEVTVTRLNIETEDGLTVKGDGAIPLVPQGRGSFEGRIEASSAPAFQQILSLSGLRASFGARRPDDFVPASVDLTVQAGGDGLSMKSRGTLAGSRLDLDGRVRLAKDASASTLGATLDVTAADGSKLAGQLLPSLTGQGGGQGRAQLRVSGTTGKLDTSLAVQLPSVRLQFDGVTDTSGAPSAVGKVFLSGSDGFALLPTQVSAAFGIAPGTDLQGEATLKYQAPQLTLTALRGTFGRNAVSGRVTYDSDQGLMKEAELKADQLSLPALLATFVSQPSQAVSSNEFWTPRPFRMDAFDLPWQVDLTARTLFLSDGVALSQAQVQGRIANRQFELTKLAGKFAGGDVSASLQLQPRGGVVSATGRLQATGIDLRQLAAGAPQPPLAAKAAVSLDFGGAAFSPRALVAVLRGRGSLGLSDGTLARLSPAPLTRAGDELISLANAPSDDAVAKRVSEAAQSADFTFRRRRIPLKLEGELIELQRELLTHTRDPQPVFPGRIASVPGANGMIRLNGILDVASGTVDLTALLMPAAGKQFRAPPVRVSLAGPVRELGAAARTFDASEFATALNARRIENNLRRLEGLDRPAQASALPWTATTQTTDTPRDARPEPPQPPRREAERDRRTAPNREPDRDRRPPGAASTQSNSPSFEDRMREILQQQSSSAAQGRAP
jgi:uncharacterized protein involved in outer membrane biogenesis